MKLLIFKTILKGKSTVTIQFVENHFIEHYNPTIEDTFQKIIKYKGVEYNCVIIDTAGQVNQQFFNFQSFFLKH